MNRSKSPKKLYGRICSMLSVKNMSILSLVLFIISLIPICCLSFVNRATGDDYGYGAFTRTAWMQTHSLTEVAKAIGVTISQYYDGWQGTWFSIGVFALQPEVFSDKAYVIVVFLMLFLWIGSTVLILWGFFAGMFVGCLALAIAEMLNSIPIFARRIGFRHGLGVAIAAAAFGKLLGSLLYFAKGIYMSGF